MVNFATETKQTNDQIKALTLLKLFKNFIAQTKV